MKRVFGFLLIFVLMAFAKEKPQIGEPAPQFEGTTLKGKKINLADYKGKVVLLDFWASWCGPCRHEMPYLIDLYDRYHKSPFEIVAINIDDKIDNAERFLDDLHDIISFTIIKDPQQHIPPKYQIKGMPSTILIDKDGVIRYWHTGFKDSYKAEYVSEIDKLLKD